MSEKEQYRQEMNYAGVLNAALQKIFLIRSSIYNEVTEKYDEYKEALEALSIILLPSLRPENIIDKISNVDSWVYESDKHYILVERAEKGIRILDNILTKILEKLEHYGLLIKKGGILEE